MAVIINPRGTSGSGKTEFVRRLLADYGWNRGNGPREIRSAGRDRPIAYQLAHPFGGDPLTVIGSYEGTAGGCDRIRASDGGMGEAFRLAHEQALAGHDVLLEGLMLSGEHVMSAALAGRHPLHVLRLSTPIDHCIRNVVRRQRSGQRNLVSVARTASIHQANIDRACRMLEQHASVEVLDFDRALHRARQLLGVRENRVAA
jgi:hypothetical protein